jgi:hypothetical protein
VRVRSGSAHIDLVNDMEKTRVLQPEQVYFCFPLAVPGGQPRIDVPYAVVRPEKDQLAGANRNYYCVQRWVDVSNAEFGATWVTLDAPMIKFHPFRIIGRGRGCLPAASFMYDTTPEGVPDFWLRHIDARGFFYSWVMTNHWECNYRAYQEGPHRFAYALLPHGEYDQTATQRAGRDVTQPLVVVPADPANPVAQPPLRVEGEGVLVSSLRPSSDGRATIVQLFAASGKPERITLRWTEPKRVYRSDPSEKGCRARNGISCTPVKRPTSGRSTEARLMQTWNTEIGDVLVDRLFSVLLSAAVASLIGVFSVAGLAGADDSARVKAIFADPPREYSSGPLWTWNDMLTEEQIRSTLRDLAGQKVKQVWVHPRPGLMTPYLSDDWFRLWKIALDEAQRLDWWKRVISSPTCDGRATRPGLPAGATSICSTRA